MRALLPLSLLVLGGCGLVDRVKDALNPIVAFGTVVVVEPPESDLIDAPELEELKSGFGLMLFLADARSVAEIDQAPVTDAILTAEACGVAVDADEGEPGQYLILPGTTELDGCDGGAMTLTVDRGDGSDPGLVAFDLPQLGGLTIPDEHTANTPMEAAFQEPRPDRILTTVLETTSGDVTYVDRPETVREWFDFLTGAPMTSLTLPGEAFPEETVYAVSITRLEQVPELGFDKLNSSLSTIAVGQAAAYPVVTGEIPEQP